LGGVLFAFMGLRMGLMAVYYWSKGFLNKELPRYEYQRYRWNKESKTNTDLAMQVEISVQALANISFLAMPALLISWNPETAFHWLEILGIIIWALSFCLETIADKQKNAFITKSRSEGNKKAVCNVGLWKYSRHPNYFFEWMVWNALIIIALPSWFSLFNSEPIYMSLFYLFGVLMASKMMYTTLVHYTGAKPAEYYSVQKRPTNY
jgi:steroid 5-alpha reductase family enzyme